MSKVLYFIAALPALLVCFVLATGWHFLLFGGKLVPAVVVGAGMTIMFAIFLVSEEPAGSTTSE